MAKTKKILIVTKDLGEYNTLSPIARQLEQSGQVVSVVAEELSHVKWFKEGRWLNDENAVSPEALLKSFNPQAVICGLGSPINLGEKYGLASNNMGIPLVHVHDIWGVHCRSTAIPDLVLAPDPFAEKLVKEYAPYAGKPPKVVVTGFPAMDNLKEVGENITVAKKIGQSTAILVLGQDESTTPMLHGMAEAVKRLDDVVIIPRLHPKIKEGRAEWLEILASMEADVLWVHSNVPTRQLMFYSHITVSIYSTGLVEAAMLGSVPASWTSEIGRQMMSKNLGGIERFPLVNYECAYEVSEPEGFLRIISEYPSEYGKWQKAVKHHLPNDGKAAERCANTILEFIS